MAVGSAGLGTAAGVGISAVVVTGCVSLMRFALGEGERERVVIVRRTRNMNEGGRRKER